MIDMTRSTSCSLARAPMSDQLAQSEFFCIFPGLAILGESKWARAWLVCLIMIE